jgi:AcrR family transcriptional regulator
MRQRAQAATRDAVWSPVALRQLSGEVGQGVEEGELPLVVSRLTAHETDSVRPLDARSIPWTVCCMEEGRVVQRTACSRWVASGPYRMRERLRAVERTRESILQAAFGLWLAHPTTRSPSMQVAAEAGVSRQTVHRQFGSKEDLLVAVIDWRRPREDEADAQIPPGDVEAAVRHIVDRYEAMGEVIVRFLALEGRSRRSTTSSPRPRRASPLARACVRPPPAGRSPEPRGGGAHAVRGHGCDGLEAAATRLRALARPDRGQHPPARGRSAVTFRHGQGGRVMNDGRRRFVLTMWEGGGTIPPELGVARRLLDRGHLVHVWLIPPSSSEPRRWGARSRPWRRAPHRTSLASRPGPVPRLGAVQPAGRAAQLPGRVHGRAGSRVRSRHEGGDRRRSARMRCWPTA